MITLRPGVEEDASVRVLAAQMSFDFGATKGSSLIIKFDHHQRIHLLIIVNVIE
jgi:hypothetical protein